MKLQNNVGRQLPHITWNSKFYDPMLFWSALLIAKAEIALAIKSGDDKSVDNKIDLHLWKN